MFGKQHAIISNTSRQQAQEDFTLNPLSTNETVVPAPRLEKSKTPAKLRRGSTQFRSVNALSQSVDNGYSTSRQHARKSSRDIKGRKRSLSKGKNKASSVKEIDPLESEDKNLIVSLQAQVQISDTKCKVVDDLIEENRQLKDRLEQSEQAKDAMMRLVWQHLETIKKITEENTTMSMQLWELTAKRKEQQVENLKLVTYMDGLEKRMFEANKRSLETLKQMRDQEVENTNLKSYIIELKAKVAVYVPVKSDPVDLKVAEYFNNYPERNMLKLMFLRESNGVYQFGSKRVSVRVEKDKILIRVGGGYLSIDEFIDQFQPIELEKIERKDPLKRYSEKLVVQKTLQGRQSIVVPKEGFSHSPYR